MIINDRLGATLSTFLSTLDTPGLGLVIGGVIGYLLACW
jgi:preprotein translocase subunit Sss1